MLWHFTHKQNLPLIRSSRTLYCASRLLPDALGDKPRRDRSIRTGLPVLRDQALLADGSIAFEGGWSLADFVSDLNRRVFFWSGWSDRPVRSGRRAFARYKATDTVLRLPFRGVVRHSPYFSRCNSGATRKQDGDAVPRGPETFLPAEECAFDAAAVVEVSFLGCLSLPNETETGPSLEGPWEPL